MKFILAGPSNTPADWAMIQSSVTQAEQSGFWAFMIPDHYMGGRSLGGDSTLDAWTCLTYLAAGTKSLRLGTLVTPIPFRPPGILAKIVSTLDVLSNGRVLLGVGVGSSKTEFEAYSKWDDARVRVDRTREGIELIRRLWSEEKVSYVGKHYQAKDAVLLPKPLQKPGPPLFFGGVGERMLRLAGQLGDVCLIPLSDTENKESKKIVVDEARRHLRVDKIKFATAAERLPEPSRDYDGKEYIAKAETAASLGCEYFITPFPRKAYRDCVIDFAGNIHSFQH